MLLVTSDAISLTPVLLATNAIPFKESVSIKIFATQYPYLAVFPVDLRILFRAVTSKEARI